ncbi:MAG: hypothetical protein M1820_005503 [Bogoriella megaspora]|nr:MAG: hypothetical protein M1820_005503 [Bogoriella megaspora]
MSTETNPSFPPPDLQPLTAEVSTLLKTRNETLSVAETAAGGLISSSLLTTPGASQFYKGGLTLYTLESRLAFAGWTSQHISSYSGPSPSIVAGLASHTKNNLGSTYCVAESGTAGPTGGQTRNRKPGYVALAVAGPEGVATREVETGLGGDRVGNMVRFAVESLRLVRDVLKGEVKLEQVEEGSEGGTRI